MTASRAIDAQLFFLHAELLRLKQWIQIHSKELGYVLRFSVDILKNYDLLLSYGSIFLKCEV